MKKALFIMAVGLLSCNSLRPSEADRKESPIEIAIKTGDLGQVENVIASKGFDVNQYDSGGFTPLLLAVRLRRGNKAIAKALLDAGADIDKTHRDTGMTPLIVVSQGDLNIDMTQLLLDEDANPLIENKSGKTALGLLAPLVRGREREAIAISKRLRNGRDKWLIKQLKKGTLPPEVLDNVFGVLRKAQREGQLTQ